MPDLRARLASELRVQFPEWSQIVNSADTIADGLLSLPGIAIVDLSVVAEPDMVFGRSRWRCRLADVNLHADGSIDVEDTAAPGDHINARALAATLLVAAAAAEVPNA